MTEPTPPPLLAYADLPARHGIQYEIRPNGATFMLPPPRWWARADVVLLLGVVPFFAIPLIESVWHWKVVAMLANFTISAILIAAAIFLAHRGQRRGVIDVTPDTLHIDNLRPLFLPDPERAATTTLRFPRADVYSVNYVEHSRHIVIRVHGHEMIEFEPARDPRVSRWLAQELRRALGLSP